MSPDCMGDQTAETLVLVIQGVRVRVAATRPAAYVKYVGGARSEAVLAFRDGDRQVGVTDSATVADYLSTGQRVTFSRPEQVDAMVGDGRPAVAETKVVEVDGRPLLVAPSTTAAQLRDMADAPADAVLTYTVNGQLQRLTENQTVCHHVPAGARLQFR